ncbi:MAG: NTP transferase domain-containing protein, partial [Euzebyales bacterium]|nr:NTP transferase domain-containing protein [Euzebyales bacterium]
MATTAIVPLKALAAAKGRLSGALDTAQRRRLVGEMLARVVVACRGCDAVDEVLLVAGDAAAGDLGRGLGLDVLVVPQPGLLTALAAADAATAGAEATLVVAADLPLARACDL